MVRVLLTLATGVVVGIVVMTVIKDEENNWSPFEESS